MDMLRNKMIINKLNNRGGVILDYNFTQLLKGLACLMIALHHYSQYVLHEGLSNSWFYWVFSTQGGYAGVAFFFFMSGYGLMESEAKHHLNLLQFATKRFWKIYKAVLLINFLTYGSILVWRYFQTGVWDMVDWNCLISITMLDQNLWFVAILLYCYLGYAICSQVMQPKKRNIAFLIGQILVLGYLIVRKEALNHLVSISFFTVGIYVSLYKDITSKILKSYWTWAVLLLLTVTIIVWTYTAHSAMPVHAFFNVLMMAAFLWIVSKYEIRLNYVSLLGYISFPIYLVHGKIIMLSLGLGHLAPITLFLGLVMYLGFLYQKTMGLIDLSKLRNCFENCKVKI